MEKCANCGHRISASESAYVAGERILCVDCFHLFRATHPVSAFSERVPVR